MVDVRCSNQAAVKPVGPAVIATLDSSGEVPFCLRTEPGATMAANVEERAQRVVPIARNNDAFTGDLAQKVVTRLWNPVYTPDAGPVVTVEALEFFGEEIGVRVITGGQGRATIGALEDGTSYLTVTHRTVVRSRSNLIPA